MIKVELVSKIIKDKVIYKDISLNCEKHSTYLLVGRNGIGKTSLLKTIVGLYNFDSGKICISGNQVSENFIIPENVGVFFDTSRMLPNDIVEKSLSFYSSLYGKKLSEIESLISLFHLENEIGKKYTNLSTGNKRKVALLISLINNPDVIIWDEPFACLDPEMCCELVSLIKMLKEQGKTFLITTNDLAYGDEIYDKIGFFVNSAKIIEKTREELIEEYPNKSMRDVYFEIKSEVENNI